MHGIQVCDTPTNNKTILQLYWMFQAFLTKKPPYTHWQFEGQVGQNSKNYQIIGKWINFYKYY